MKKEKMKNISFYDDIQINDDINFISVVCTPWQIQGTLTNINYLQNKGIEINGLLIVIEHGITGRCLNEKDFLPFELYNIEIYYSKGLSYKNNQNRIACIFERFFSVFLNNPNDRPVYILNFGFFNSGWSRFIKIKNKRNYIYILGDDGTGGYNGYKGLKNNSPLKKLLGSVYLKILKNKLIRNNAFIDNRILSFKNDKLVCRRDIAKLYVDSFKNQKLEKNVLEAFNGKIIINSQCLYDNHEIFGNQDIDTYRILYDALGDKNQEVLLKPHPRELSLNRYDEFKWKIWNYPSITQEEIISNLEISPRAVIGITSSTLINLNALFGIKTISLAKIFSKFSLPEGMRKDVEDFIILNEDFVLMPSNSDELVRMLDNI